MILTSLRTTLKAGRKESPLLKKKGGVWRSDQSVGFQSESTFFPVVVMSAAILIRRYCLVPNGRASKDPGFQQETDIFSPPPTMQLKQASFLQDPLEAISHSVHSIHSRSRDAATKLHFSMVLWNPSLIPSTRSRGAPKKDAARAGFISPCCFGSYLTFREQLRGKFHKVPRQFRCA